MYECMHLSFVLLYVFSHALFIYLKERERKSLPSTVHFSDDWGPEVRSFPQAWQLGWNTWAIFGFSHAIGMQLDQKQSSMALASTHRGCWHHRQWLFLLCHNASPRSCFRPHQRAYKLWWEWHFDFRNFIAQCVTSYWL